MKVKKNIFFGLGLIVVSLIISFFIYHEMSQEQLKLDLYEEFTCSCCETNLLDSTCFMAGGMREYIDDLVEQGYAKDDVLEKAIIKFGFPTVVNIENVERFGLDFVESRPENTPNISIRPSFVDLGEVSISKGIVIVDYKLENVGEDDLIVYDVKTSCSCATASFIKDGKESVRLGRFSHSDSWTYVVDEGEDVILRVYIDPRVTDWQLGSVERHITLTTNDPIHFEKTVRIGKVLVP